ncbi:polysaccharide biosynthesis tyrosine autokinase [Rhizobium sp. CG5]|uniref:polysaccharide biosynthesis tyrosine autokinase n=1 Tax=Rhizobium sp. CG5 TaxID=2726076 RepID=UPI0020341A24|nr:polysaccharide biosynthesis tyrosine autokinase [Rhizobium sp. CG5]MCM2473486.1 polysaccharide biosynthesis tyrosine autokinase [Rhizobium sp. CG5]
MNERSLPLNSLLHRQKDNSDSFIDLERLLTAVMRRTRIVALSVALMVTLGIAYLVFATPIYTSQTQILLDDSLSRYAEEEETSAQSRQQADTQISSTVEILKSGKMALRVVDEAGLAENETILDPPQSPVATAKSWLRSMIGLFDMSTPASDAAILSGKRQKAAALIQQSITVERVSRSAVVALSYKSPDPQLAAKVTNAYAEAFLTDQLNANFDATEKASVWLQQRLADLGQRAQAASLDVERYKTENGLTSTRGQLMSEQQLADLSSQLIIAQADAATAGARYRQFKSIIDQGPEGAVKNAVVSSQQTDNSVIQELRGRYLAIEKREQEITQNFGADHPQAVALRTEKTDVAGRIFRELEQLTASYGNEFDVARSREQSLRDSIDGVAGRNSEANRSLVRLGELEQKATALKSLYESYLSRYELATQQQSFPIAKARVISEAGVPVSPSAPKRTMVLALSVVLGLMLGGALGFFQEMQERFFRLENDVRKVLGQKSLGYLPLIGAKPKKVYSFPALPFLKRRVEPEPKPDREALNRVMRTVLDAPRSAFTETLRNTKLAADIILQGRASRVIGVVSSIPGEGKSTVAANFAVLLAASGKRTLLIDGDLRNPSLSRLLKPSPTIGLVEVVLGEVPWTNAVKIDQETKLHILPVAGRASPHLHHTNELLASPGMTTLIDNVRQSFDYVIVDLAPLGPVVDAKAFSPHADGFIFVVEWGKTPTRLVSDILDAETQISAKILGVILNKTDMTELGRYGDFGGSETMRHNYAKYYVEQTGVSP